MERLQNKKTAFTRGGYAKPVTQALMLLLAGGMMWFGVARGEMQTVFYKAVNICLECIGLG